MTSNATAERLKHVQELRKAHFYFGFDTRFTSLFYNLQKPITNLLPNAKYLPSKTIRLDPTRPCLIRLRLPSFNSKGITSIWETKNLSWSPFKNQISRDPSLPYRPSLAMKPKKTYELITFSWVFMTSPNRPNIRPNSQDRALTIKGKATMKTFENITTNSEIPRTTTPRCTIRCTINNTIRPFWDKVIQRIG